MRSLLLLPLIFAAACRAPQGEVITSPLVGEVRTALSSTRAEAPRLVLGEDATMPNGAVAICYENYIVVMGDGLDALDYYIAHELVHWYIDDSPYAGLPHFLEEGFADWIACDLTGTLDARRAETSQLGSLSINPRHLALDVEGWRRLPASDCDKLTRAGFDLVHRLGLEQLRELARAGSTPDDYLRVAGVQ
jgi:hypothetical protein